MKFAALLLVVFVTGVFTQTNPPHTPPPFPPHQEYELSFAVPGFDIIFSNDTSFLDQVDYFRGGLYVSGNGVIFQVNENPTHFNISEWPYFNPRHQFLDFKTFTDARGSWAIGSVPNRHDIPHHGPPSFDFPGMNYPLAIAGVTFGSNRNVSISESPPGFYMMGAVTVEPETQPLPTAYFAGWHQHNNASAGVNFTVIRVTVNTHNAITEPPIYPIFTYDHNGIDRVYLHGEDFIAYNSIFKPEIHRDKTHIIIVDPATNSVFRVSTPPSPQPLGYNEGTDRLRVNEHFPLQVSSSTYDANAQHLYLGLAAFGVFPGRILQIDVSTSPMKILKSYSLTTLESNPKSLSLDAYGPNAVPHRLYVGLYGGHSILRINLETWTTDGFVTLPFFLHDVYDIVASPSTNYVYFVTNEQNSKVGRVSINNFCPSICDVFFGYCHNGQCACGPKNFQLADDGRRCTPVATITPGEEKLIKEEHNGEVALGILFALTFILAAVGWYLVYKARGGRGAYSMLESAGLLQNK